MIHVNATGRLTKGAELRVTPSGKAVANFTLACKRDRVDKEGNTQTTFIQCVIWGKPAQALSKFTGEGALIGVSGELQNRSYDDQQGNTHYVTELVIATFEFLESKETAKKREENKQNLPTPEKREPVEPYYGAEYMEEPPM